MQDNISSYGELTTSAAEKAASPVYFSPNNPFLESPSYVNSSASSSIYSSLFQNYSPENSPSEASSFAGEETSCVLEYQQLYNRYTLCLAHLHDSIDEVAALRRENETLRLSNVDLARRVALLFSRDRLLSEFNRLTVAAAPIAHAPVAAAVLRPLAENTRMERRITERVAVPKSISVRSRGYLKTSREQSRQSAVNQSVAASQRVYIPTRGSDKEEAALEFEVYNQGNLKTELCNKWQETGACPYGENCQFAHGIKELRPVIRHPRYKTEVCRMVLAGDICPYGHRCHFRHSLTEQERLMMGAPTPPC